MRKLRVTAQFLGGVVGALTGSCILLTIWKGKKIIKILIDCGLVQGRFDESSEKNREILKYIDPEKIDIIILTHGHLDHVGRVPFLVKHGFKGKVYCTASTGILLPIMLYDNCKIMKSEIWWRKKSFARKKKEDFIRPAHHWRPNVKKKKASQISQKLRSPINFNPCDPLYEIADVEKTLGIIRGNEYCQWVRIEKEIDVKFYPSGHVLGGAVCVLRNKEPDGSYTHRCFTGDLGREDGIILPPPEWVKEKIDQLVIESTYGDRIHPPRQEEINQLLKIITQAKKQNGKVIIPSFALERAQEIIFLISKYVRGDIKIHLDSPMASKILKVFAESWEGKMFKDQDQLKFNPFNPAQNKNLLIVESTEASTKLIDSPEASIIVAGAGMCNAGRVRGHLRRWLGHLSSYVCLIGYMAEKTLGRKLIDTLKSVEPMVRMNGEGILIKANIVKFESFSAHADKKFLIKYASHVDPTDRIFIVHGEESGGLSLKKGLHEQGNLQIGEEAIIIPRLWEEYEL